jgi:hypothetical protein
LGIFGGRIGKKLRCTEELETAGSTAGSPAAAKEEREEDEKALRVGLRRGRQRDPLSRHLLVLEQRVQF